jgi:hypothetical protein
MKIYSMTALQTQKIKDKIIRKIQKTDDVNLLGKLEITLNEKIEDVLVLSKTERTILRERLDKVKKGNVISNNLVMKEMKEWLQAK